MTKTRPTVVSLELLTDAFEIVASGMPIDKGVDSERCEERRRREEGGE
jgi:hypothetical protein